MGNIKLPRKKWKWTKYLAIGLGVLILPAIIFTIIYFVHEKPKNEAYTLSHEYFLGKNYSQVVTLLEPYSVKGMPYIVLYELAYASVTNERLDEEQKKNVLSNITLQTDANYFKYWIHLGRGEAEDAVDIARAMEDGELITFGLLKRREEVKADKDLTGEEMQILLNEIDQEVEEFEKLMLEAEEAEKEAEEEAQKIEAEKEAKTETAKPAATEAPAAPTEAPPAPPATEAPAAETPEAAPPAQTTETTETEENAAN